MYNRVIEHMMEYVCSNEGKGGGHLVVATHNEVSKNRGGDRHLQTFCSLEFNYI